MKMMDNIYILDIKLSMNDQYRKEIENIKELKGIAGLIDNPFNALQTKIFQNIQGITS